MNEFIEQFILESRDHVEHATAGLLTLENAPQDAACLDTVFRALHTLKGSAGIVDFAAMERAVHAAEEVLAQARAGKFPLTAKAVGACLACVDQVVQWLDRLEASGELPPDAEANAQANAICVRIARATGAEVNEANTKSQPSSHWVDELLAHHGEHRPQAITAVRFIPAVDCFFQGDDPIAIMAALPQLLALELSPVGAWPTPETLNPFDCFLSLSALTGCSANEVGAYLSGYAGEHEVVSLGSDLSNRNVTSLSRAARQVLEAQIALLNESEPATIAGRIASAGAVATNVLRHSHDNNTAQLVTRITERSFGERNPQALREQLAKMLAPTSSAPVPVSQEPTRLDVSARTLRIEANRVDALVDLTGELTVVKNGIGHILKLAHSNDDSIADALKSYYETFDHLISELQTITVGMRVLPLRTVLQRFPRVVREMTATLSKPANLVIKGEDTEADKAIVEMLFEPLLHIVRNAMDHGIESAELRAQNNKPAVATIQMHASRQGDHVLIEVSDDGGGVNVARVKEVALNRGIATSEQLNAMSEAEIVDLVFAPGFSTAATVTELSGRGVGMDAVRIAVERIGGRVTIESRATYGTTVKFTLPFSVMMTQVMTVEVANQMFGVPLDVIVETVRVPKQAIVNVGSAQAIVFRNRTIPLIELATTLGVQERSIEQDEATVVVTQIAGQLGGIRVDRIGERLNVILKPLNGLLQGMSGLTGTTLLGDGHVLLVLDITELLQ